MRLGASRLKKLIPVKCLEQCVVHSRYSAAAAKSLQSCLTLCDPTDGSPPGSTIPGILQARTQEWGAIAFSTVGIQWVVFNIMACD